jgi:ABC-type transport system involved in multi-copper enzyme maturation permease subunit
MRRALHAEWTKVRTVPSTTWLILALVASTVLASAMVAASLNTEHCPPTPPRCDEDIVMLSLGGIYLGQMAAAVLGVLVVSGEYGTRMIRTTLAVNPRRAEVLAAKAAVVTALVLGAGALGVLGALAAGRAILPGNGFTEAAGYPPLSLVDGPTLRAAAGSVLYLVLLALLSLGIGVALRHTALSLVTVIGLLFVLPMLATLISNPVWATRMQKFSPMTAGLAIQATKRLDNLPITPWWGVGLLAAYTGAALIIGGTLFKIRDA